jgi:hypothetical protein
LTFSSSATHCPLESGSSMKVFTDLKFFRDVVLFHGEYHIRINTKDQRLTSNMVKKLNGSSCGTYGTLWSTVAKVQSGLRTGRPALRLERVNDQQRCHCMLLISLELTGLQMLEERSLHGRDVCSRQRSVSGITFASRIGVSPSSVPRCL